jgi:hypothetical protein
MDVPRKSIADLVAKGMPREGLNEYDLGRCLAWYVRYLHGQMRRKGITEDEGDLGINLRAERCRFLRVLAELSELDLSERRAKLIPVDVYDKLLVGWRIFIRRTVLTLPSRLSGMLIGLDRRGIQDTIERECRDMLLSLSRDRPADDLAVTGTAVIETETRARRGTA